MTKSSPCILIIAGELSGDRYAAELAKECKSKDPLAQIVGIGGQYLAAIADKMVYDTENHHVMGVWEQFKARHRHTTLLSALSVFLETTEVDHAIIIDFQHMNGKIADRLSLKSIPITTFITPSFWVWNDQRGIKKIASYSDAIVTIFEKEYQLYKVHNHRTYYFGHPVVRLYTPVVRDRDVLSRRPATIMLYPGSREQEVHYHFPDMLEAVKRLQAEDPTLVIHVVSMSPHLEAVIKTYLADIPVTHLTLENGFSERVLSTATFAITVAGTATLDLMLNRIPMISLGKVSYLTYLIGTYLLGIKLKFAAMPNIIADHVIVPDLILSDVNCDAVYREAKALLNAQVAMDMVAGYDAVIERLSTGQDPFEETIKLVLKA